MSMPILKRIGSQPLWGPRDVESAVFNLGEKEVESKKIGEILMDKLQQLDPVAYVRFASVYREFKDVNTFMSELKKMLDK